MPYLLKFLLIWFLASQSVGESALQSGSDGGDYTCSKIKKCLLGCCGLLDNMGNGICGLGPEFCGPGCTSSCDQKSECDPGWGIQWSKASTCPLNVCCSRYGFCGTTSDFCGGLVVSSPQCDISTNSSNQRTVGYYEGWNWQRSCGKMTPQQIPLGYYTHINFAFSLIDPSTYRLTSMDDTTGLLYQAVSGLKRRQPGLQVWLAVGGWAMNDPGKFRTVFSRLAASPLAQDTFFESLVTFLELNDFDGVDIDWEYPVADDRGGIPADFENYVLLLSRLRARLNNMGRPMGLSVTLPASYWYLRGFDIINLEPHVDWYNVMTYDIHGVWDSTIKSLGPSAHAHTNLTEINEALELLWRNNINPARVNLGLGFYGRSFTMSDPNCMAAGCPFKSGGHAGTCTGIPGILSAAEITKIIADGAKVTLDPVAAVQIVTWDQDQWVSWDDTKTLTMKLQYANKRCLGGLMVWAIDLDDGTLIKSLAEAGSSRHLAFDDLPDTFPCFGPIGNISAT
ncbi:hypothetical protein ASPZODRAFT_147179 [Penicilliopsis zonata CBS 506.65]|uniref:chitinase n=1 Tax=Penicilliopsis zonata CBS 506.65 TaxID=1073090 RepID=A0A1L9S5V0_9EURO|nr:hypothetical protein ASPZODRAFT_147179 [Penicilliopsis zonata CBS 506.65]OJJ42539.1 hypothetical protein ASPZODRAFT_147179 [Penicilliopsis zonata CBS 506.65]